MRRRSQSRNTMSTWALLWGQSVPRGFGSPYRGNVYPPRKLISHIRPNGLITPCSEVMYARSCRSIFHHMYKSPCTSHHLSMDVNQFLLFILGIGQCEYEQVTKPPVFRSNHQQHKEWLRLPRPLWAATPYSNVAHPYGSTCLHFHSSLVLSLRHMRAEIQAPDHVTDNNRVEINHLS